VSSWEFAMIWRAAIELRRFEVCFVKLMVVLRYFVGRKAWPGEYWWAKAWREA
jgi:hypothetical protein